MRQFWKSAAGHDLSRIAANTAEAAAMLRDRGHVSEDSSYEFNDLDDRAFVTSLDGLSALWLKTQHGGYGILLREGDSAASDQFSFARVDDEDGWGRAASAISPDLPVFLGAFNALQHEYGRRRFDAFLPLTGMWRPIAALRRLHHRPVGAFRVGIARCRKLVKFLDTGRARQSLCRAAQLEPFRY